MNADKDRDDLAQKEVEVDRELADLKSSLGRLQDAVTPAVSATKEAIGATRDAVTQVQSAWRETKDTLAIRERVTQRPLAAIGISAAAGFMLGARRHRSGGMIGKAVGALASIVFMRLADSAVTYATAKLLNERDLDTLTVEQKSNGHLVH